MECKLQACLFRCAGPNSCVMHARTLPADAQQQAQHLLIGGVSSNLHNTTRTQQTLLLAPPPPPLSFLTLPTTLLQRVYRKGVLEGPSRRRAHCSHTGISTHASAPQIMTRCRSWRACWGLGQRRTRRTAVGPCRSGAAAGTPRERRKVLTGRGWGSRCAGTLFE